MNISSSVRIVQLAKTKAITDILTHATEGTSEGQAVFNFGLWLHHMKTGIIILNQFIVLFAFVHNDHFLVALVIRMAKSHFLQDQSY